MKKNLIFSVIFAVLFSSFMPGSFASAATTDHSIKTSLVSADGSEVTHTIMMDLEKKKREKKLDLVIVQDLSGSFKGSYPQVAAKLNDALDLLDPVVDRTQFMGYTGLKTDDTNYPLYNDPRADLSIYNAGQISEGYNVLLKGDLTSDISATKSMISEVATKDLFGRSTPTAYGIDQALKAYQQQTGPKDPNRETLFLVVTDGFPNGDINGTPLTPATSMLPLLGPTTGIIAALNNINNAGYQTSFGLWQEKASIVDEWGQISYDNYNNYINDNIPNVVTRPEFFLNMTTSENSIEEFAAYVRDIVLTNINEQLSVEENIASRYTYVADSAVIKDASGNTVAVPAPYNKPTVTNNKFEWNLDALPEGQYTLSYQVKGPNPVNEKPVLTGEDKTVPFNSAFDPLKDITFSATDKESGNLTSSVTVKENTVDTSKAGVYKVVYEVTDTTDGIATGIHNVIENGKITYRDALLQTLKPLDYTSTVAPNTVTTEVQVTVLAPESVPVIDGKDQIFYVGDSYDPRADMSATDSIDGDLTDKVTIKENTVDNTTPGVYKIVYEVTNSLGKTTTREIKVTVLSRPTIDGKDQVIYVGDEYDPRADMSAFDLKDGDITSSVTIKENTVDNTTPGVYKIVYEVTNSVGETATKEIKVTVLSRPTIDGKDQVIYVGDEYDPKADMSAFDLKDGDITSSVTIKENTVDNTTPGVYKIVYEVTNSVGETATKEIKVTVLSRPTIDGKDQVIYVGDEYDPRADMSAFDLKDGDITSSVTIKENTVDNTTPGVYKIVYEVTNSVGETATREIKVTVLSRPVTIDPVTPVEPTQPVNPVKPIVPVDPSQPVPPVKAPVVTTTVNPPQNMTVVEAPSQELPTTGDTSNGLAVLFGLLLTASSIVIFRKK
ncbi:immunoglobulin-like domain-containing protein [Listeria rustica]|uniref:DUF5011 domain-containing protein n=1 Tax=Listeria rustica TaxID=2713503 RepID=A0A7W1T5B2_9LIST|nr:immunoglobulin-like domain-containing protein [Listeria rustica]MBA3925611.1 DUF5011 domain-containing protein [Listeria rustica]